MITLKNNKVIKQLRTLHRAAMTLKESFDKKEVIDVIRVQTEIYKAELEKLKLVCPEDILTNDLLRHSALLSKYVTENKLE